jgi:hypothetical protein
MSGSAKELAEKIRKDLGVEKDQSDAAAHAQASRGAPAHQSADTAATKLESLIKECKGMCNSAGDDLDGALGLTRSQIAGALGELSGARAGRGQGNGTGSGSGVRSGSGTGAAGTQAGGASGRPTLLGPHGRTPGAGKPTARINLRAGTYNTQGQGFDAADAEPAERLDPDSPEGIRRGGAGPPGVPLQYRRLAEQYFKRLAEDTKN